MSELTQSTEPNKEPVSPPDAASGPTTRRVIGALLLAFALLLGWFLLVGLVGWQRGETDRLREQASIQAAQIDRQLELAEADIGRGSFDLAQRRLAWVMTEDPGNRLAGSLKSTAEANQAALVTPTATPAITAVPTATSFPTPTPGPISSPDEELQRIRRLVVSKAWDEALPAILNFQRAFPSYERTQTDQYLYDTYLSLGMSLVEGKNAELGLYYLAQARKLGDLPTTSTDFETWAELYLQGVSFYGANWDAAAYYFRDLCRAAPFYQSSCERLRDVLVQYGDQQVSVQEWCPAQTLYEEAVLYSGQVSVGEKLNQAREMCLLATPTPEGEVATPDGDEFDNPVPDGTVEPFEFSTPTPTPDP